MTRSYSPRARMTVDLAGARLGIYSRASDDSDDTETSVTAQGLFGERWAIAQGCVIVDRYCDNDISASMYTRKQRGDFQRLLKDIDAGKLDYVWFWTLSRSQRRLDVYVQLRDLCRAKGVGWVIKRRVYDLNDAADVRALNTEAGNAEVQSMEISENVVLGLELAASQGKPHGPVIYGYRREYDGRGKYVGQFPDDVLRESSTGYWYSPAAIVREIVSEIARGIPIAVIKSSLEERGIPAPKGGARWSRSVIRTIATNLSYLGKRSYRGELLDHEEPCWTPLIEDAEQLYAAQNLLSDPKRKTTRPGRGVHLLSGIARCTKCKEVVQMKPNRTPPRYVCGQSCISIFAADLDEYIRSIVDGYLARDDVREMFAKRRSVDPQVKIHRAEAERLRGELNRYKDLAISMAIDANEYAEISRGIKEKIRDAERKADELSVPAVLMHTSVDWNNIPVARQIVSALLSIEIRPIGKGNRAAISERVSHEWLIGYNSVHEGN